MKPPMRIAIGLIWLLFGLGEAGGQGLAGNSSTPSGSWELLETALLTPEGTRGTPSQSSLRLSVAVTDIYCKESSCKCIEKIATRRYEDFCRKLLQEYNIELQLVYFQEPYELEKAFLDGKFSAYICKPWILFHNAEGRSRRMVRIADLQDLQGNTRLWGLVIVPKDSSITDLKAISGHRIAYGQPDAFEKHQGALALFKSKGLKFNPDKLIEKASCLECLDLLMKGNVAAAVISNYTLTADCAVDVTTPDAFRVLGETEKIPLMSFIVDRAAMSEADLSRLQRALVELSAHHLPATMSGGGFVRPAPWTPGAGP